MTSPSVQWTSPVPMWSALNETNHTAFDQPSILRFDTDYYMEELLSVMQHEPQRLPKWHAKPETWRIPAVTPQPVKPLPQFAQTLLKSQLAEVQAASTPSPIVNAEVAEDEADEDSPKTLKLYQPAQMRHYMVTADLICRIPGLPHRRFNTPNGERPTFVLRRLLPNKDNPAETISEFNTNTCDEYAYVQTPRGAQWRKVDTVDFLAEAEDRLPMFALSYNETIKRKRRILAGIIPVGRREQYINAQLAPADSSPYESLDEAIPNLPDKRLILFQMLVTEPWRRLRESKNTALGELATDKFPGSNLPPPAVQTREVQNLQDRIQMQSWYILLDLKEFLQRYVKPVFKAIQDEGDTPTENLNPDAKALYDWLTGTGIAQALRDLDDTAISALQLATQNYTSPKAAYSETIDDTTWQALAVPGSKEGEYPELEFLLVDNAVDTSETLTALSPDDATPAATPAGREQLIIRPDDFNPGDDSTYPALEQLVRKALLQQEMPTRVPAVMEGVKAAMTPRPQVPGWFIIRCVFERPNCVPYEPELMSDPTESFQMASYYDPEAPARPIRIALPEDTTLNGLRKHQKNTLFTLSEMLCGQVEKARSFSFGDLVLSVLPWPFHKDLPGGQAEPCGDPGLSFGLILSLSIPIITIAGLLLLIIVVSLLDQIFRWLPYFITLIPIINTNEADS